MAHSEEGWMIIVEPETDMPQHIERELGSAFFFKRREDAEWHLHTSRPIGDPKYVRHVRVEVIEDAE